MFNVMLENVHLVKTNKGITAHRRLDYTSERRIKFEGNGSQVKTQTCHRGKTLTLKLTHV